MENDIVRMRIDHVKTKLSYGKEILKEYSNP
jgi:hypothetical protein